MASNEPNLVDWLTLAAAALGTLLGAFLAVWQVLRSEREKFDLHLEWEWFGDGPIAELPFVYVHNRSASAINIVSVSWYTGAVRRTERRNTALHYEDPGDVNFPYAIAPGDFRKLFLDDDAAVKHFETCKHPNLFGFFRRPSLWLSVRTMRGKRKFIGAERALPWRSRPSWLLGKDES